jgi:NAD(P)H-nitrite reductase large subunit
MSTVEGQKTVVVIGNGMVGHKFCEKLVELDVDKQFKITSFCEEKKTAYNRMRLTEVHSMLFSTVYCTPDVHLCLYKCCLQLY